MELIPGLALILALWWGPGLLVGAALGLGWRALVGVAPLISVGVLTAVGVWSGVVGLPWNLARASVAVVVLAAITLAVRLLLERRRRSTPAVVDRADPAAGSGTTGVEPGDGTPRLEGRALAVVAVGIVLGVVVGAVIWWRGTDGLVLMNQDWDIPWHANMIRLIAEAEEWTTSLAGNFAYYDTVVEDAPIRNYPIAFHAIAALAWPGSGLAVPQFLGLFQMMIVAVQLPLSAAALTWHLTRRSGATALAALAATMLSSFPYDLLFRGPLIPLVAGLALLGPFVVAAARSDQHLAWRWRLVAGIGAVGLFGAHASIAVVAVVVLVAWFALAVPATPRAFARRGLGLVTIGVIAAVLAGPLVLEMLRESGRVSEITWPAYETVPQAFGEVLFLSHGNTMAQWGWAILLVVGCFAMLRSARVRWYLFAFLVAVAVAAMTAGSDGELITSLTAFVYNDSWRLVGFATLLAVPVIGMGGQRVADAVVQAWRGTRFRRVGVVASAVLAALLLSLVVRADVARNVWTLQRGYREGSTVTAAERQMMESLTAIVPPEGQVLNDACDGSVWMFALADRMPMIRHFEIVPTDRQLLLLNRFNQFDTDPEVQQAAAELGITHVYVSDGRVRGYLPRPAGLEDLDQVEALEKVAENEVARVYEIDWDRVPGSETLLAQAAASQERRPGVPGIWQSLDPAPLEDQNAVCI